MNRIDIFKSSIWKTSLVGFKELQPQFIEFVERLRNQFPLGSHRSVDFGWQSPIFRGEKVFDPLCECIADLTKLAITDSGLNAPEQICVEGMWANYNNKHTIASIEHTHHEVFAGVCYVLAPEHCGELFIRNSGLNPIWDGMKYIDNTSIDNKCTKLYHSIKPKEGDVYLWQSHMPHFVVPDKTNSITRLSVSFTISFK